MEQIHVQKYFTLIEDFVSNRIGASEFEKKFLEIHRADTFEYSENVHRILSILFSDIDDYCSNPEIRDENDLDDEGLLIKAKKALDELRTCLNISQ